MYWAATYLWALTESTNFTLLDLHLAGFAWFPHPTVQFVAAMILPSIAGVFQAGWLRSLLAVTTFFSDSAG